MLNWTIFIDNGRLKVDVDIAALIGTNNLGGIIVQTNPGHFPDFTPGECACEVVMKLIWGEEEEM